MLARDLKLVRRMVGNGGSLGHLRNLTRTPPPVPAPPSPPPPHGDSNPQKARGPGYFHRDVVGAKKVGCNRLFALQSYPYECMPAVDVVRPAECTPNIQQYVQKQPYKAPKGRALSRCVYARRHHPIPLSLRSLRTDHTQGVGGGFFLQLATSMVLLVS